MHNRHILILVTALLLGVCVSATSPLYNATTTTASNETVHPFFNSNVTAVNTTINSMYFKMGNDGDRVEDMADLFGYDPALTRLWLERRRRFGHHERNRSGKPCNKTRNGTFVDRLGKSHQSGKNCSIDKIRMMRHWRKHQIKEMRRHWKKHQKHQSGRHRDGKREGKGHHGMKKRRHHRHGHRDSHRGEGRVGKKNHSRGSGCRKGGKRHGGNRRHHKHGEGRGMQRGHGRHHGKRHGREGRGVEGRRHRRHGRNGRRHRRHGRHGRRHWKKHGGEMEGRRHGRHGRHDRHREGRRDRNYSRGEGRGDRRHHNRRDRDDYRRSDQEEGSRGRYHEGKRLRFRKVWKCGFVKGCIVGAIGLLVLLGLACCLKRCHKRHQGGCCRRRAEYQQSYAVMPPVGISVEQMPMTAQRHPHPFE